MTNFHLRRRLKTIAVISLLAALSMVATDLRAFTVADADAAFSGYIQAFYFTNADGGFFHETTEGRRTQFWQRAEQLEMVLDVYERTTNASCLEIFSNSFNGFVSQYGTNWHKNIYNDDIMWMVIACARARQLSGNPLYGDTARLNFDLCYQRAWSTNLDGGMWWRTDNQSKNACVNGPAAIAACLLYQIYGDTNYLAKSEALYQWERSHLFDEASGRVFDNMNRSRGIGRAVFTYNTGTFVGAANFLGHTNDARLAADCTRDDLSRDGILPSFSQNGDLAGFNSIGVRWIAKFMRDRGLEASYQKWLQTNADAAWRLRRPSDNLSWSRWTQPTPDGLLYAWGCSCSVVIMHVVPPTQE
jgi:predicted alpha-1,6-mannanase (GH76 family)